MGLFSFFRKPPGRTDFARLMERALRDAGETRPIVFEPGEFRLRVGGERGLQCYLGNIYDEFLKAKVRDREAAVRRFARAYRQAGTLPDTLGAWPEARSRLMPRLRERMYFEHRRLNFEARGKAVAELPYRPIGEHLGVTIVYDFPDSMLEIGAEALDKWDVSFDEALEAARDNLWEVSKERLLPLRPGLWRSPWADNYDASRLLLHDLVWQFPVKGAHVAVTPNRDTLLVTGSDDAEGLLELLARAIKAFEGPRPMGARPLLLAESRWRPLDLPPDHPAYGAWKRAELLSYAADCAEQKGLLDAVHQARGDDLFVATFNATERTDSGEVSSYAVWSEGVPTLLPRADRVAFVRRERVLGLVPWARVLEGCAGLMTPQGVYPERWRVDAFPDDATQRSLLSA
jgi:hypothetical protein